MNRQGRVNVVRSIGLGAAAWLWAAAICAQHPAINLLDAEGNVIDPINGENAEAPFSSRQTCGQCHDYDTITRGYHFQMGWDEVTDDFGREHGRPWKLSDGFMGGWYPYAYRQLAKKNNRSADEIDMTLYEFVGFSAAARGEPPCGACHPGGGGLEFDRDGERYDERQAREPELAQTLDGDYYRARWQASGVVEADCLLCHQRGYDFQARVEQLTLGNYRWAVVAGSRLGRVVGAVRREQTPKVLYETRLFNRDGTITLEMSWPPPDGNCVFCHSRSDVKKRGFSWNDFFNPDIHNQQRISCAACHPGGLEHQFAKGRKLGRSLASTTDRAMQDCRECHMGGFRGAPVPDHETVRRGHLKTIACESCHIPHLGRAAVLAVDTSTGLREFVVRPRESAAAGGIGVWRPDLERRSDGIIDPINHVLVTWWGNRDQEGVVHPLFLREQQAAWGHFRDVVVDDDGDGRPEVNREEEIAAGLRAVAETLAVTSRFTRVQPVLIKGETGWELDDGGELQSFALRGTDLEGMSYVNFGIHHNVAPTRQALGSNGCGDCHTTSAHFFAGQLIVDLVGDDGTPVVRSHGKFFGCNPFTFYVNSIHQRIISPYIGPLIMIIMFLIVLHYHSYGPKRITFDPYSEEVQRFNLVERGVHLFRLLSFAILAVTGLILAFNLHLWQELLFGSPEVLHNFHIWAGAVFIVTTVAGLALWIRDAAFESYDREWARKLGGYLGHKGEVPAGRFNAGQKMFFWYSGVLGVLMSVTGLVLIFKGSFALSTVCLTSTVHNLFGFFLIAGVLAHAYLGTVANPGTWRVLVDGSVTRAWAKHHHPNWYAALLRQEAEQKAKQPPPGEEADGD